MGYVHAEVDTLLGKGRISPDRANRLKALVTGSTSKDGFADADFVIEAVFEELAVKQQVFAEVEAVVSAQCVLATNTSSLSITEMAAGLAHPERVVGFHFFNPVAVMPLLEIIRGERTDDATLATAFATGRTLKKTCILVKDSPSFIANRLLGRLTSEVSRVVDEGTPLEVADRAFGGLAPMPPFVLLGLVGPAIALHNTETLHAAFPERFYVSENLRRVVEAGKPAFYVWPEGKPVVDPEVAALMRAPGRAGRAGRGAGARAGAVGPGTGGAADARRGRRRRPPGPRPGDDHRRRVLVLERRHHARCWTGSACPRRSTASGSCRSAPQASPPEPYDVPRAAGAPHDSGTGARRPHA